MRQITGCCSAESRQTNSARARRRTARICGLQKDKRLRAALSPFVRWERRRSLHGHARIQAIALQADGFDGFAWLREERDVDDFASLHPLDYAKRDVEVDAAGSPASPEP